MIVTDKKPRRERLSASRRATKNLDVGDYVFNVATLKRGFISEIDEQSATVDYLDGEHDCLPRAAFRRVRRNGRHDLDARKL